MYAHSREGHGGGHISLDRPVLLLSGVQLLLWLQKAIRRPRGIGILMEGNTLVAGQEVTAGESSLALADEGLFLCV